MRTAIITGSAGLIGSETVKRFAQEGARVVGIDNDMRAQFFGVEASTKKSRDDLITNVRDYEHHDLDIRDASAVIELFKRHQGKIDAIVHTASQPSHDWAARDPQTDFTVNANGTLNLLEAARTFSPEAPFIFTSTNKAYGDTPNGLPLRELEKRWARTAWFSLLLDDLCRKRPTVPGFRVQRKTGQRQHSQLRFGRSLCRIHSRPARGRGLQHRRRPA